MAFLVARCGAERRRGVSSRAVMVGVIVAMVLGTAAVLLWPHGHLETEGTATLPARGGSGDEGGGVGTLGTAPAATATADPPSLVPDFQVRVGAVRPALPYRIVSFHRGRADKNLIKLAAGLGINGVMFQLEGSNEAGIKDFAARDAKEHLVDYCHKLGMEVTVWVHELSDLPDPWMPESLGPVDEHNERLWQFLEQRYDWVLRDAIPQVDGLVLTVVETQVRATATPIMLRVADVIDRKCRQYGKKLIVRTFVWHPEELAGVMGAVAKLPQDAVIMSKCVPQDWQMRGTGAKEIGAVGGRTQIVEYDAAGEYFLRDHVANCMVDWLKQRLDDERTKGISGICVRVDRDDMSVLFEPSEVNLWTLGLLAAGATDNTDDVWNWWAGYRYGAAAAAGVIRALKPTQGVVAEMLSIGPFTHGDTRAFPPLPDEDVLHQNWQNWWWDASFVPAMRAAQRGDATFIAQVAAGKAQAMARAEESLAALEEVRPQLPPVEYAILRTKLVTNAVQLAYRGPMVMVTLRYQAWRRSKDARERQVLRQAMEADLAKLLAIAQPRYEAAPTVEYLGKTWPLWAPEEVNRERIFYWAYQTEQLLQGKRKPAPVVATK